MPWVKEGGQEVWREQAPEGKGSQFSYFNAFILFIVAGTVYVLWTHNVNAIWLKGLVYSGIIIAAFYGIIRIWNVRMGGVRQFAFIMFGIILTVGMMDDRAQEWMKGAVGFQVAPLGLLNVQGQLILDTQWLIVIMLGIFLFGLLRPKNIKEL